MQQQNINRSFRYFQHSKPQPENQRGVAVQSVFGGSAKLTYAGVEKKGLFLITWLSHTNPLQQATWKINEKTEDNHRVYFFLRSRIILLRSS